MVFPSPAEDEVIKIFFGIFPSTPEYLTLVRKARYASLAVLSDFLFTINSDPVPFCLSEIEPEAHLSLRKSSVLEVYEFYRCCQFSPFFFLAWVCHGWFSFLSQIIFIEL